MGIDAACVTPTYANTNSFFAPVSPSVYAGRDVLADVSEQSSALSKYLVGRIAERWELVQLLPIRSERDGNLYIVSDSLFSVYGDGDTELAAQEDYVTSLIEYYQLLARRADDVFTRALLQKLRRYLRRV